MPEDEVAYDGCGVVVAAADGLGGGGGGGGGGGNGFVTEGLCVVDAALPLLVYEGAAAPTGRGGGAVALLLVRLGGGGGNALLLVRLGGGGGGKLMSTDFFLAV